MFVDLYAVQSLQLLLCCSSLASVLAVLRYFISVGLVFAISFTQGDNMGIFF